MNEQTYDYCIVGAGAAGLHLAIAMASDPWFDSKQVLLIDKSDKSQNDRTWCFWEVGDGKWDHLIEHKWGKGKFMFEDNILDLDLKPYQYKKLNGIKFYNNARQVIGIKSNIHWIQEDVLEVKESGHYVEIICSKQSFQASHCFDSRIVKEFGKSEDGYIRVLQHFKGWNVCFEDDVFDSDEFTMMDFRLRYKDSTSFTYILPVSSNEALVEFTLFNKELLPEEDYDHSIESYISTYMGSRKYEIRETEFGVIPMTTFPFHKGNTPRITKIGTAGSWVRPSSGYSFKYAEKNVSKIVANLKTGNRPEKGIFNSKYHFYDTLLLDILYKRNHLGPKIFYQMYSKNPVQKIFRFLDGETQISEDIKIISTLDSAPFLRALVNYLT